MMWLAHAILASSIAALGFDLQDVPASDSGVEQQDGKGSELIEPSDEGQIESAEHIDSESTSGETFYGQAVEDFSLSTYRRPIRSMLLRGLSGLMFDSPDDAVLLEPGVSPIYVPPYEVVGWDFDGEGRPVFIARDAWDRLVWRRCNRELTPMETRVIPGVPSLSYRGDMQKVPQPDSKAIYLGQDRWWLAVRDGSDSKKWQLPPTIYDSSSNQSVILDELGAWLETYPYWDVQVMGDGRGGALVAATDKLISVDGLGQQRWSLNSDATRAEPDAFVWTKDSRVVLVSGAGEILLHTKGDRRIGVFAADGRWLRNIEATIGLAGFWLFSVHAIGPNELILRWAEAGRDPRRKTTMSRDVRTEFRAMDARDGKALDTFGAAEMPYADQLCHSGANRRQELKSDGALWADFSRLLARIGWDGAVQERLASADIVQNVEGAWRFKLLQSGLAIVPNGDVDVLHIWKRSGQLVHATGQAVPSRFEVATDTNGAVWLSPVDYRGVSSGPAQGWAADGTVLGELFAGGRLAFDPSGSRVWSCESIEDQSTTLRLFDLDGTLLTEHVMYRVDETEMPIEKVQAVSVNDKGVASLWLGAETGSRLVRFGPEGQQHGAWEFASLIPSDQPAGQHGDWILATRKTRSFFGDSEQKVIVDLFDPEKPRYASVEDLVDFNAESFGFSPDGTEIWSVFSNPISIAKRPIESLRWRKL